LRNLNLNLPVLAADRIVEGVVLVPDTGDLLDRRAEQFKLPPAAIGRINHPKLPQAVVRRGVKVGLRLREGEGENAPEIQFVVRRDPVEPADPHRGRAAIAVAVREVVRGAVNEARLQGDRGIERTEGMLLGEVLASPT
jgi:hypothetical protein